jgi:RHS repeat-associated protein
MPMQSPSSPADSSDSNAESSPFRAPQIELPKGGGAIRGIGEKFEANPATGTGKLTIPLGLSSGRSGFGPSVSIAYDSGSGNGVFGLGWGTSLPSITRKTDKGLPTYRRREVAESDVYVLSQVEDLVPVLIQDGDGCWVDDQFQLGEHEVKRYRPRIEGQFARIERWTRVADGDQHWRSISEDNTLTVYGRDADSRICDPENPQHIFSWLICGSYDDKGNAIHYEYVAENDEGVDPARASENRRSRTANRYIKRILYGNRRPLLLDHTVPGFRVSHLELRDAENAGWMFEAVFDYGDEGYSLKPDQPDGRVWVNYDSQPSRQPQWTVRKDPFSNYRSRFEIRTYRLCQRVLMFHHFPEELHESYYLVRSTEFEYRQKAIGSFLTQVTQSGYVRHAEGRYLKRSMPPLEFDYTASPLEDTEHPRFHLEEVDLASLANLPAGIDDDRYKWVDLDGEGISGVLAEQGSAWYYKPNAGHGKFGATEIVARRPSISALSAGRQQLLDLAGDGTLNLVQFDPEAPGFYERTLDEGFGAFREFQSLPVLDWKDPNLRFVDVTGDGIADILITENDALLWHPSLQGQGFGPEIRVAVPGDERKGPHVIFADGIQSIYLADMSGDGLSDLVRIRNGEVCYWPNRGYGNFGPKIVMENAPWFEVTDLLDQSRVKLADTDGSGCTDIVYLGKDAIRIYLNEAGNGWSDARVLSEFPPANPQTTVSVVDFLGRSTACILWSSSNPADSQQSLRYLDLMDGEKPHLLTQIRNNLGAETRIEYASSTEFYLADKAAGRPWITRLPFPVHVVKRVTTYDFVSRNRFASTYTYHHGFFDGLEREFRGFAMVEQLDTEVLSGLETTSPFPKGTNEDSAATVPPVLTKTWFHTGVFLGNGRVSRHLAHEYYREPGSPQEQAAMLLDDTILPEELTAEESREACRALKGTTLRQEVFALDGREESDRPYSVTESNAVIRTLQPRQHNLHAVFFTHARESVSFEYDRKLYPVHGTNRADPRVSHNVTLEVDEYGNVLKSVTIAYPRRFCDESPLLSEEDRRKQHRLLITLAENRFTNAVLETHAYRTPIAAESRSHELIHLRPAAECPGITNLFHFEELKHQVARACDGWHNLPYEDIDAVGAAESVPYRRLLEESRTYYRADKLDRILPLGVTEALALPGENFKLVFTLGLLRDVYRRDEPLEHLVPDPDSTLEADGRYRRIKGTDGWWAPSGHVFFSAKECEAETELEIARRHFFVPRRFVDVFGYLTIVSYDGYDLLPVEIRDAVGNTVRAEIDYRVLAVRRQTDANRNRSEAAYDALGLVVGKAVMGKLGERAGDSLDGFDADLDEATIRKHMANPLHDPHAILKQATTRLVYDLCVYMRTRDSEQPEPLGVYSLAREVHASDLRPGESTKVQHSFSYSDGFGRQIQKRTQAEPGRVTDGGPEVNPRWVSTGWTIFNNKGKAVRKYEPFFSNSNLFEFAKFAGVSSILFYDPADRVVATLHPDHTYEKVIVEPWKQITWDVNDTSLESDPASDEDVGYYFRNLPNSDYLPTWYDQRIGGSLGKEEKLAAVKTSVHARTPSVAFSDTLGRTIIAVAHNRFERDAAFVDEFLATRTDLDIQGNQRAVIDALGRIVLRYDYNMLKTRIRQFSADAGTRWMLNDVLGKAMLTWDSRMHRLHHEYDALHRPTKLRVKTARDEAFLAEQIVYGEGLPNDLALNLRGKPVQQFDAAGIVTSERYDFKGNLLRGTRQFLLDWRSQADWSQRPEIESTIYANETSYDALNRPVLLTTPDGSVARPKYNEGSLLESLEVSVRGAAEPTPFVTYINYNARGQRTIIDYGNGPQSRSTYDPLTFRMTHLVTHRKQDDRRLQDLRYVFDPVGNVTSIRDDAQQSVYFKNQVVAPGSNYTYDAIYRLIATDGREHAGHPAPPEAGFDDLPRMNYPLPSDGHALHRYEEQYEYDAVGNILKLLHVAPDARWSRHYRYDESQPAPRNNRLTSSQVGQHIEPYAYDADGNMTGMPHLTRMSWNYKDQLCATRRQVTVSGHGEITHYVYDASGQRVRKVTERGSGSRKQERVYVGNFEIFRRYDGVGTVTLERETLHVMNEKRRVALVETKTVDESSPLPSPVEYIRYQFDNHLGSSLLELDRHAAVITYEEYYAYGSTSFEAAELSTEVSRKRYRYTGKERDEETGLYYIGARYYASWLGRWTAADPAGPVDGPNLYQYSSNNPIRAIDPTGTDGKDTTDSGIIKMDLHKELRDLFRSKEWKAAIKKSLAYKPHLMSREEFHAWLEQHDRPPKPPTPTPTPTPAKAPEPNVDPPQSFSPPGATYQSAPGQPLGGFSVGGFFQNLSLSGLGTQSTLTGGLVPPGGDWGAEIQVQNVQSLNSSSGSTFAGPHGWYGPNSSRYNLSAYALLGNASGQNPSGTSGNFGATGILAGEGLFGGPDRDHPWFTLGANFTAGYLHYLSISPPGQPDTNSTNVSDSYNVGGTLNATFSFLYAGKTPRLQAWAEGYGSHASGSSESGQPGGSISIGGGGAGLVSNTPFGPNGWNILTIGIFGGGRSERDNVGSNHSDSNQYYFGAGVGFARRFW